MFRISVTVLILAVFLIAGCGKEKEKEIRERNEKAMQQEMEENDTSSLTPAESFGAMLTQSILNDETEIELESFLSETVYPKLKDASKVTIDKISSSYYLITFSDNSGEKQMLIRKFYIPKTDEITFDITETGISASKQFFK